MYSFVMIEFDEDKRASNILKHGIDFTDVEPVFSDPRAFTNDRMFDTKLGPEQRHITTGMDALGRVITVIWTTRGNNQRIISARASRKKEAAFYQA
jgi:uncharacterized protein